ncbi:MAG TPA: type III-B CRISPR-associated protein Cas10/Cmr2 [Cyanobacteria bacterium UBA11369]|nr:type III-B CRISPR-associated protein Cas10/Cmr2 [Cyanobacteria bacterium UBA11371]HBE20228.1 type III-B CRISPR-associated protein Cas10/Cmr2 [Cyanobacteria bacterium UBA11367]HBE36763.1 type III-B CRISPR-associated protein Cas10/Cmr2 [Cyanobacteria bacterium UBA11368]HBE51153.1 type III-B CRISPR-associated protein Cas10/Cmr2 [Cyanobacteria bacterium UBA11369]
MIDSDKSMTIALSWCLAWGDEYAPRFDLSILQQMRDALRDGGEVPEEVRDIVKQVQQLQAIGENYFPSTLEQLQQDYPELWEQKTPIGLVYGGATKIKQYVFEAPKLPDIRGASSLLDRINLIDLPAFFHKDPEPEAELRNRYNIECQKIREWLDKNFASEPKISKALIPELIIYSTGGNILAFCPAAFVNDLANAIEKRYTERTLTANSCAVGDTFRLLEIRFGLLKDPIESTFWLEQYRQAYTNPLVEAYFGKPETQSDSLENAFFNRKSFNELTTKLAILFNQRRSGNEIQNRTTRRYPPMFETHPYLQRDESEKRSIIAIVQPPALLNESAFSEASIRKRVVSDRAKTGFAESPQWYRDTGLEWDRGIIEGWVDKFVKFLHRNSQQHQRYCSNSNLEAVKLCQSLTHLSKVGNGFVAYIYADANNMGGFIQKIRTPQKYKEFSEDVFTATEHAVYQALAENLHPRELKGIKEESGFKDGDLIHPFEIITIGGDDIILIVPASQALAIAKTIGEQFEKILLKQVALNEVKIQGDYQIKSAEKPINPNSYHRYSDPKEPATPSNCQLSMSIGVLITDYKMPIYYAKNLTEQLLKSAKKYAKSLKKIGYCGGTVDFLVLKGVTMISSNIEEFRQEALTKERMQKLKLYAAPYTLYELGGLIKSIGALKRAEFPRSQLYQIRSLLERGKHTAILNYRYFRTRLQQGKNELKADFEEAWCKPKDEKNNGNLAPWTSLKEPDKSTTYETIWREMVDLYDFIDIGEESDSSQKQLTKQEADL